MPELGPQTIRATNAFVQRTAHLDPETRSGAVSRAIEPASTAGRAAGAIFTAGFLEANARAMAVATRRGLFAYHRSTDADLSVTARTPDGTGSGWATAGARDWGTVDPAAIGRIAAQKAVASRNPQTIEPGTLHRGARTVGRHRSRPAARRRVERALGGRRTQSVLEAWRRNARRREGDGRSGDALLGSDRSAAARSAVRFRGAAARPHGLGRERAFCATSSYSRFWAQKQGKAADRVRPLAGGLVLAGGTKTTEEVIAGCERGILVTHFFYIRSLDPRTVLQTGPHARRHVPDRKRQGHAGR